MHVPTSGLVNWSAGDRVKAYERWEAVEQSNAGPAHSFREDPDSGPTHRADISMFSQELGIRLLEGIPEVHRTSILGAASWQQYPAISVATNQGDQASQLFLLIKGSARFFFLTPKGQKVYLIWLKSGEIFGGTSLLRYPSPYLVSTEITKGSRAFVWKRDVIREFAIRFPRLLENALSIASDYMTWYLATHLCLVANTARERLAHVIVSLADGIGKRYPDGIHLSVTNEQLANTANISVFTTSRLLRAWQETNVVSKRRSQLIVRSPEQLSSAASVW